MRTRDRRWAHGMAWGVVATLAMGAVAFLMMALHLWPARRPLSVLLIESWLGHATVAAWVLAAIGQLVYGAACGALLAVLSEPVTVPSAIGLGFLRWFATGTLLFPALGWADFGLRRGPGALVATAIAHLTYALVLGTFMRREDTEGVPVWHLRRHAFARPRG